MSAKVCVLKNFKRLSFRKSLCLQKFVSAKVCVLTNFILELLIFKLINILNTFNMNRLVIVLTLISLNLAAQGVDEKHLKNVRQLTFGGNNAEAYFSRNDKYISFQSDNKQWGLECDQIFYLDVNKDTKTKKPNLISTGFGRTTCSFFMPNGKGVIYASTHEAGGHACPMPPEMGKKYLRAGY